MATSNQTSSAIVKKLQTLVGITNDLRQGKHYNITRLTLLKSLCSDPDAAAKFALHIAKLAQQQFKARPPSDTKATNRQLFGRLIATAIPAMARYLKAPTEDNRERLRNLYQRAREAQNKVEHQHWADVRMIECWELLIVETAMDCMLDPWATSVLGYQLARQYSEKYDPHFGTGLIPKSAPMIEAIAEFWGKHYLGRGWRKKVGT